MSYRYTNTEKWGDSWFSGLKQLEMLLFMYLCDNCDIAGFIEVNYKRWAVDLNSNTETIKGALKGLQRGIIFSKEQDCIYLKNFLRHQKNLPLSDNNKAHIGILRRFDIYRQKFDIQNINDFIEGASKGLQSPYGNGIGKGSGNGTGKEEKPETEILKLAFPFLSEQFKEAWQFWKSYKLKQHRFKYKSIESEQAALNHLTQLANGIEETAIEIIKQSMGNGWHGFFELKITKNGTKSSSSQSIKDSYKDYAAELATTLQTRINARVEEETNQPDRPG